MRTFDDDLAYVEAEVLGAIRLADAALDELRKAYSRLGWLRRRMDRETDMPISSLDQELGINSSPRTTEAL